MSTRTNYALVKGAKNVPQYPGRKKAEAITDILIGDLARRYAGHQVQRLLGFWVLCHTYGSFNGYRDSGLVSRGGAYAQLKEFRELFDCDPIDWHHEVGQAFPVLNGQLGLFDDVPESP